MRLFRVVEDPKEFEYVQMNYLDENTSEVFGVGVETAKELIKALWDTGAIMMCLVYIDGEVAGYTISAVAAEPCTKEIVSTLASTYLVKKFRSLDNLNYLFDNTVEELSKHSTRVNVTIPSWSRFGKYLSRKGLDKYMETYTIEVGDK